MNYRFIKIISTALLIIFGLFLNSSFVYAEDIVLQSKSGGTSAVLYNYNIGSEDARSLSELVPVDYDNALEKLIKKSHFIDKNLKPIYTFNASGEVTTYHNPLGLDYADFHSIIDNELALHPDSLGLIAAHDQISPLEWEDKLKKLSAKGMDHLSYAEKFDLALCLEYDDARVKRSESLTERTKKADEILTALWKVDKQPIVWYTHFDLYFMDKCQKIVAGAPDLEIDQEYIKKESALDDELIAYAAGDTILNSMKKAQSNGWKDAPISTYNLPKCKLKYLLRAVNGKADEVRRLVTFHSKTYPAYLYNGKFDGYGGAEYAYWQRWVKQIETQLKEANAAK
jgi:hypothetical protein